MRHGVLGIASVMLVGLSTAAFGSAGGASSPAPALLAGAIDIDELEAAGFARQRGISKDEAARRLRWQEVAPELSDAVARDLGDRAGGVWIDIDDGDRVKVGVVRLDDWVVAEVSRIAGDVGMAPDGYDLVAVQRPWAQIEAHNRWLGDEIARANVDATVTLAAGLRPDLNAVELLLPQGGDLTADQNELVDLARRRLGDALVIGSYEGQLVARACGSAYCGKPLRGGVRITSFVGGCTAGFLAQSKVNDKLYLFTAGHCGSASGLSANWSTQTYNGTGNNHVIGPVWHWYWHTDGDMAIIRINDPFDWQAKPWVHVTDGPDTTEDETYHIKADKTSVHGMRICTTGSYYGASDCGFVTQLGLTATYASGVTVHNLGRGSFCGTQGDSGAPMYALHNAFGLQVGGFKECDSVYQGIKAAETKLNVNVLHSNS